MEFFFYLISTFLLDLEYSNHADNVDCVLFSMSRHNKCWSMPDEDSMLACAKEAEEDFMSRIPYPSTGVCSCRKLKLVSDYVKSVQVLLKCELELYYAPFTMYKENF